MTDKRKNRRGQAAIILILLTAAAMIFYAITLNWGRVAQTKALVTVAADQAAALLASDIASYGEMEKQTYLKNKNEISSLSGIIMAVIAIVVAIICLIITITTAGGGSGVWCVLAVVLAAASVVMAVVNLALQIAVIQPGITRMWNKLQMNQPITQQFYEGGLSAALQESVTDTVNITDYFDLNTNGLYGVNMSNGLPNDTVGRFAFFYTDRLKMINKADTANKTQVAFFASQLGEFLNGETCGQNITDHQNNPGVPVNPACLPSKIPNIDCIPTPAVPVPPDPACQMKIPGGFQLNDTCSDTNSASYSPYCDPCCQPPIMADPAYCDPNSSPPCTASSLHPTPYKWQGPANCYKVQPDCNPATAGLHGVVANPNDPLCVPAQCASSSNPYGASYPYIYDPTYQEYNNGASFLDQLGRDLQSVSSVPLSTLTLQGSASNGVYFPNGVFPFFWLMKDFSPQVDNLLYYNLSASQVHWCVPPVHGNGVIDPAGYTPLDDATLSAFPDLTQLTDASSVTPSNFRLPYTCTGPDCCVNSLANTISGSNTLGTSSSITITINGGTASPARGPAISNYAITDVTSGVTFTTTSPSPVIVQIGDTLTLSATVIENGPGNITVVNFKALNLNLIATATSGNLYSATLMIPKQVPTSPTDPTPIPNPGGQTYSITVNAADSYGYSATSSPIVGTVPIVPIITDTDTGTDTSTVTASVTDTTSATDTGTAVPTNTASGTDTSTAAGSGTGTGT